MFYKRFNPFLVDWCPYLSYASWWLTQIGSKYLQDIRRGRIQYLLSKRKGRTSFQSYYEIRHSYFGTDLFQSACLLGKKTASVCYLSCKYSFVIWQGRIYTVNTLMKITIPLTTILIQNTPGVFLRLWSIFIIAFIRFQHVKRCHEHLYFDFITTTVGRSIQKTQYSRFTTKHYWLLTYNFWLVQIS